MTRKILAIALTLAMVLTLATFPAFAEEPAQIAIVDGKTNYEQSDTGHTVRQTYDGNTTGSYYQTKAAIPDAANPDFYLVYDLGKAYNLTHMDYYAGSCYMKAGIVYGSNTGMDATDWTEIGTFSTSGLNWTTYLAAAADFDHSGYYRYIKIQSTTFNSASKPVVREIVFTGVEGTPALPEPPETPKEPVQITVKEATSNRTVTNIAKMVDNNPASYAQLSVPSDPLDFYYMFDLGSTYKLTTINYYCGAKYIKSGEVYATNDVNGSWTLIATFSGLGYNASNNYLTSPAIIPTNDGYYQYVKIVPTELSASSSTSMATREIMFYGVEGTPGQEPEEPTNDPKPIKPTAESANKLQAGSIGSNATNPLTDGDLTTYAQVIPGQTYFDGGNTGDAVEYVFKFDKKQEFTEFEVYWSLNRMTSADVYVSNDGVNWGNAVYSTGAISYETMTSVSNGSVRKATFTLPDGVIGRYFKLVVTGLYSSNQATTGCMFREIGFTGREILEAITPLGGSIRASSESYSAGLRFAASVDKAFAGIEGDYVYADDADTKFGMFLLPKDMLTTNETLADYIKNGGKDALDVPAKKIYEQDETTVVYTAVLTEIPAEDYDTEIVAVPYMLKNGEYTYFDEMTKSYLGVATAARNSTYSDSAISKATGEEKNSLIEIAYQLDCIINGTDPDYDPTTGRTIVKEYGFNGTTLDTDWTAHNNEERQGGSYWSNSMYTVANGNLTLSAIWDSTHSYNGNSGSLKTAGLSTTKSGIFGLGGGYEHGGWGYYEAKIKFPGTHKGAWGAFWAMMGNVSSTANGAADGVEIDFIETIGNDEGKCQSAVHWDGYYDALKSVGRQYLNHNIYDGEWHMFGCERGADGYKFYIDGRLMSHITTDEAAACDEAGFLLLSVEAATWAAGASDYSAYAAYMSEKYAEKTDIMSIDYVRVWE